MTTRIKRRALTISLSALAFGGLGMAESVKDMSSRLIAPLVRRREVGPKLSPSAKRRRENREGYLRNRAAKIARNLHIPAIRCGDLHRSPEQRKLINGMSNWQNHQWMKKGCPMDVESLAKFADMPKKHKSATVYAQSYIIDSHVCPEFNF